MNIYVGNIPRESTENEVKQAFAEYGEVTSCKLIKDKISGVAKGFGFVEMPNKEEAKAAIKNLDGQRFNGRVLNVAEAKPRTENKSAGGYNKFNNNNSMNKRRY